MIFFAIFANANLRKIYGMKTKKIAFFGIFLFLSLFVSAQTVENKKDNMEKTYYVKIETSYGEMVVKLYNETPLHRDNFVKLVKEGFYDSLLFHRVISNFMIQGGDPKSRHAAPGQMLGDGSLDYTIPAEFRPELFHKKGALAAARMGDAVNPQKASSSCQFYLVQGNVQTEASLQMMEQRYGKTFTEEQKKVYSTLGGTPFLDGDYTVFGEVVEGIEVIDKIAAVRTARGDRPMEDVRMKISLIEK